MQRMMTAGLACGALILAGCVAEGFSEREVPGHDVTSYLYESDALLADSTSGLEAPEGPRPPIVRPASLAVVQVGEVAPPTSALEQLRAEKDLFREVSGVSGIAPGALGYGSTKDRDQAVSRHVQHLRRVARDLGADYLLVYGGTVDTINRGTALTVLDITVIAMFVVPSRVLEAEGRGSAILIDVDSGRVLATATADGSDWSMTPSYGWEGHQRVQMRNLRDEIVEDLMAQTLRRFAALDSPPVSSAGHAQVVTPALHTTPTMQE